MIYVSVFKKRVSLQSVMNFVGVDYNQGRLAFFPERHLMRLL